jgi:hypothetical protein
MEGTGWRRWIGFGVFSIVVVGVALFAAGWVVLNVFFKSCGC